MASKRKNQPEIDVVVNNVRDIRVSAGVTINVGNYESTRFDMSLGVQIPEGEAVPAPEDSVRILTDLVSKTFDIEGKRLQVRLSSFLADVKVKTKKGA